MDLAVLLVGLSIALCEALDAEGMHVFVATIEDMGRRPTLKPAEQDIFRRVADALNAGIAGAEHRTVGLTMTKGANEETDARILQ